MLISSKTLFSFSFALSHSLYINVMWKRADGFTTVNCSTIFSRLCYCELLSFFKRVTWNPENFTREIDERQPKYIYTKYETSKNIFIIEKKGWNLPFFSLLDSLFAVGGNNLPSTASSSFRIEWYVASISVASVLVTLNRSGILKTIR